MPFANDPGTRESELYCSYCYKDGVLHADNATLKEFKERAYEGMRAQNISPLKATLFSWLIGFSPYWKNRKKQKNA